mmetsp:Transcript_53650/g.143503  ORF Transcript_53650/g.143503 Transcript_53650/m.143503 type:complete len:222 (+) Transcript_53650:439-1104(+)
MQTTWPVGSSLRWLHSATGLDCFLDWQPSRCPRRWQLPWCPPHHCPARVVACTRWVPTWPRSGTCPACDPSKRTALVSRPHPSPERRAEPGCRPPNPAAGPPFAGAWCNPCHPRRRRTAPTEDGRRHRTSAWDTPPTEDLDTPRCGNTSDGTAAPWHRGSTDIAVPTGTAEDKRAGCPFYSSRGTARARNRSLARASHPDTCAHTHTSASCAALRWDTTGF